MPESITRPMRVKAVTNEALSAAMRRSHASARLRPAPAAAPLMAAIAGLSSAASARTTGSSDAVTISARLTFGSISLRSCPVQKPRPSPVRTTARTASSCAASLSVAARSVSRVRVRALSASGLLKVSVSTPSARVRTNESIVPLLSRARLAGSVTRGCYPGEGDRISVRGGHATCHRLLGSRMEMRCPFAKNASAARSYAGLLERAQIDNAPQLDTLAARNRARRHDLHPNAQADRIDYPPHHALAQLP